MKRVFHDLAKHSVIYSLAHIFIRAASFLLLPLYTRHLRPADYGCMAILDLTSSTIALLIGSGISAAAARYHFEARDRDEADRVWWTAWTITLVGALLILTPAWTFRASIARLMLGSSVVQGPLYFALILPTILFGSVAEIPSAYVRVRKWSVFFVGLVVARVSLNIALNVFLLVEVGLGVEAILLGNLIVGALNAVVLSGALTRDLGRFGFHRPLAEGLVRFGSPLTMTSLLLLFVHQADRYLLRLFLPLDQLGIYSLAYTLGEGVTSLLQAPFVAIWSVTMFEIARQPNAKSKYVSVFRYFFDLMLLVVLAVSLFARPILELMAARDFAGAADLIPVIGLGYVLFCTADHFKVPALLANRTMNLVPVALLTAVLNVAANLALIPLMGIQGAALATVLTFGAFSLIGLVSYRRIDRYDYPLARCLLVLLGVTMTFLVWRWGTGFDVLTEWRYPVAVVVWLIWAGVLFWSEAREQIPVLVTALAAWFSQRRAPSTADAIPGGEGT